MRKILTFLTLIVSIGLNANAQGITSTSGGKASGNEGTVCYTVGQMTYTTNLAVSGSVAQGVQQPLEISLINGINNMSIELLSSTFPNPAKNYVILKIDPTIIRNNQVLTYQLYDIEGKLEINKPITSNETNISISNLVAATYILKVLQENKEVKTFRIIKK